MTKSRIIPAMFALSPLEHPRCPRCDLRMPLVAMSLGPAGRDCRMFECPKCSLTETAIADDPMKSKKAGCWLQSELKPPQ